MFPVEIKEKVYWVGAVDWDIRDFHGYSTYKGTTYNAYLIMDDKITLVDTVKNAFKEELINHISQIVDPGKIDYLDHQSYGNGSCRLSQGRWST